MFTAALACLRLSWSYLLVVLAWLEKSVEVAEYSSLAFPYHVYVMSARLPCFSAFIFTLFTDRCDACVKSLSNFTAYNNRMSCLWNIRE